jgi:hypothetical protein
MVFSVSLSKCRLRNQLMIWGIVPCILLFFFPLHVFFFGGGGRGAFYSWSPICFGKTTYNLTSLGTLLNIIVLCLGCIFVIGLEKSLITKENIKCSQTFCWAFLLSKIVALEGPPVLFTFLCLQISNFVSFAQSSWLFSLRVLLWYILFHRLNSEHLISSSSCTFTNA